DIYREVIEKINTSSAKIVSIDIPSGLDADKGVPLGVAVKADYTITLMAPKRGLLINQGPDFAGRVSVEHIGCKI
ncbi:MAG: bifunctional ADP-dependent NAD(P)H-hydrate dehydratase/NAD(P)H-hydrate epimerase, partial [Candidatus Omnitrophica bacterium]|nr:bifunctional ADP-dependent NAD(P)H-hydrate dehydratase/NAD(P)H-hydrate epimerase [Candidatus Omnitrophota bacterium]